MFVRLMLLVRIHSETSHVHVTLASLAMEHSVQVENIESSDRLIKYLYFLFNLLAVFCSVNSHFFFKDFIIYSW